MGGAAGDLSESQGASPDIATEGSAGQDIRDRKRFFRGRGLCLGSETKRAGFPAPSVSGDATDQGGQALIGTQGQVRFGEG